MIRALSAAATGLEAQQTKMENISNDLANVNTDGFKRNVTEFQDLVYETVKEPGAALGASSRTPVGVQVGIGVKVGASLKNFEPGPAKTTNNPFDFMIEGPGFFQIQTPQGETVYSRAGAFHRDAQGILMQSNGGKLIPQVVVPPNVVSVLVSGAGEIKAMLPTGAEVVLGQMQFANFQNDQGLSALGHGLYRPSTASGPPIVALPGENGMGFVQQGALEGSNVNVANSMVDMITTQRAYEMNTKVMGVADQMMGAVVNIK